MKQSKIKFFSHEEHEEAQREIQEKEINIKCVIARYEVPKQSVNLHFYT